jgi:hypothetical protein
LVLSSARRIGSCQRSGAQEEQEQPMAAEQERAAIREVAAQA